MRAFKRHAIGLPEDAGTESSGSNGRFPLGRDRMCDHERASSDRYVCFASEVLRTTSSPWGELGSHVVASAGWRRERSEVRLSMMKHSTLEKRRGREVLVIAALPEEVGELRRRIRMRRWSARTSVRFVVTGTGAARAGTGLARALRSCSAEWVIVIGFGGGLAPGLSPGDVIAASEVRGRDWVACAPDQEVQRVAERTGARPGTIITHPRLLLDPRAKEAVWSDAGRPSPASVDLESATYVRAAQRAGVRWTVLRAITDTADEALPAFLDEYEDARGGLRRRALTLASLSKPDRWPSLWFLHRRARLCASRLADAASVMIATDLIPPA